MSQSRTKSRFPASRLVPTCQKYSHGSRLSSWVFPPHPKYSQSWARHAWHNTWHKCSLDTVRPKHCQSYSMALRSGRRLQRDLCGRYCTYLMTLKTPSKRRKVSRLRMSSMRAYFSSGRYRSPSIRTSKRTSPRLILLMMTPCHRLKYCQRSFWWRQSKSMRSPYRLPAESRLSNGPQWFIINSHRFNLFG